MGTLDGFSVLSLWPPFGPSPGVGDAPLPPYAEHPWLVLGYNATVRVEYDANADGAATTDHGGIAPVWLPLPGHGALRCAVARRPGGDLVRVPSEPAHEPGWTAIFGRPVALDLRHRLVVLDEHRGGKPRHLYVARPSEDIFSDGAAWSVMLREYYDPRG
jgi:hypothetical protein